MAKKAKGVKRNRGPKPTLTPEVIESFIVEVKKVFFLKHAIREIGRSERALYNWIERGEKELRRMDDRGLKRAKPTEAVYVKLVLELNKAKAENIRAHTVNVQRHALGQPAQFLRDKDGQVLKNKEGNYVQIAVEIRPDPRLSLRYLEAVDRPNWGQKIRQEIAPPEDMGPSELRITVVKARKIEKLLPEQLIEAGA